MILSPNFSLVALWQVAGMILGAVVTVPARRVRSRKQRHGSEYAIRSFKIQNNHALSRSTVAARAHSAHPLRYQRSKRILDLVLGSVLLLAGAPLMLLTAIGILLALGRPIWFSQKRVGRGGRLFWLHKFRTLPVRPLERSEIEWSAETPHRFAALLRATGLDELPQLINVVRGEMSLVGPRPERPHFVKLFQSRLPSYTRRHDLPAGITGWAQINGYRGDTSISGRLDHDLYYLKHASLRLDLRILGLTLAGFLGNVRTFKREQASGNMRNSVEAAATPLH